MTRNEGSPHPRQGDLRGIRAVGGALLVFALAAGPEVLGALLSPDGQLGSSTRMGLRALQGGALLSGLLVLWRAPWIGTQLPRLGLPFANGRDLRAILVLGIVLRLLVQVFLDPSNNDPHWSTIRFIVEHGRTPIADEVLLGFQPPLYYLLAAALAFVGSMKLVQALSMVLSLVNLVLIHRFLRGTRLLRSDSGRRHALVLAAILPQFLLFSGFVSNDALAFPLGTLALILALRYVERPSLKEASLLGVVAGLGLLTKGTLIGNVPVLAFAIVAAAWIRGERIRGTLRPLAVFCALTLALGCYKFVENQVHFGTPVVGNDILHQEWVQAQEGTYRGLSSLLDANVVRLARHPFVGEETLHAIPLLFYGTFWGAYIQESNWNRTRTHPYKVLPPLLDLAGLVPTILIFLGLLARTVRTRSLLRRNAAAATEEHIDAVQVLVAFGTFAAATVLVLKWGLKHDAWSFFQSRLVFPSFLSLSLGLGFGVDLVRRRGPALRALVATGLLAVYLLICAYYAIEIGGQIMHPSHWPPGIATS